MQETWLRKEEISTIKRILMDENPDCRYIFNSSMDGNETAGRPFGGIGWAVHRSLFIKNCISFHSNRISSLKLKNLTIIGVYLPYFNGTNESLSCIKDELCFISSLINKDKNTMIIGDFNADLYRQNKHDLELHKWMMNNNLTALDLLHTQTQSHTFNNGLDFRSWIDHIFIDDNTKPLAVTCYLLTSPLNLSDHDFIQVTLENLLTNREEEASKKNRTMMKWDDYEYRITYEMELNNILALSDIRNELHRCVKELDMALKERKLEKAIDEIHGYMKLAETNTINSMKNISHDKNGRKHKKKKRFWSPILQLIHENMVLIYLSYNIV